MKQANMNNWKVWVRYAHNDLGIALREMERKCNPRQRVYEAILMHCQQSAASRDKVQKFNLYLRAGVREYWSVNPDSRTVSAYLLSGNQYVARNYADADVAPVNVLEGCSIVLRDMFAE